MNWNGERNSPQSRMAGIRICNEQVPRERGMVVVDEAKVPTIWISNAPAKALDDSVRRRFDYSIRFEKHGHAIAMRPSSCRTDRGMSSTGCCAML